MRPPRCSVVADCVPMDFDFEELYAMQDNIIQSD